MWLNRLSDKRECDLVLCSALVSLGQFCSLARLFKIRAGQAGVGLGVHSGLYAVLSLKTS